MATEQLLKEFVTLGGTQLSLDESGKPLEPLHETKPRKPVYKPRRPKLTRERFLDELCGGRRTVPGGKPTETLSRKDFLQELRK